MDKSYTNFIWFCGHGFIRTTSSIPDWLGRGHHWVIFYPFPFVREGEISSYAIAFSFQNFSIPCQLAKVFFYRILCCSTEKWSLKGTSHKTIIEELKVKGNDRGGKIKKTNQLIQRVIKSNVNTLVSTTSGGQCKQQSRRYRNSIIRVHLQLKCGNK